MTAAAGSLHLCCSLEHQKAHMDYALKYLTTLVLSSFAVAEINRALMFLKGKTL